MFNSYEKTLNVFIFSINCFIVTNDVLLQELKLKQVSVIKFHALYNLIIKRPKDIFIGRILESSCLSEAALMLNWNYDGFPSGPFLFRNGSYTKNIILQMIILINRIKEIVYRSTKQKTLISNATIKSKLGNPVKIYKYIDFLSFIRNLYLNKVFREKFRCTAAGDKIETKVNLQSQINPNFHTYRSRKSLLAFELGSHLTTIRSFTTSIDHKSVYIDKSLTKSIKFRLKLKQWITFNQKKLLIKHVEICQTNLSALSTKKNFSQKVFYFMELLLNSLLFQVYTVETFFVNKRSRTLGIANKMLKNVIESKLKLLSELKNFKKTPPLPLKQIYTHKKNEEKYLINIPCIINRLIQQLFVLVLDPLIEANSDPHSYGFRKGRNQIMLIGTIQKNLQNQIRKGSKNLEPIFVWNAAIRKCFDSINHKWFLKNVPFPQKYKYILKAWLKLGYIKFESKKIFNSNEGIRQGEIISPLLVNLMLNGMEDQIYKNILKYKEFDFKSRIKYASNGKINLILNNKWLNRNFKKRQVTCKLFRYADNFVVLCSSNRLIVLVKKTIKNFLEQRGLQVHPNKNKTIPFYVNTPFDFLGYTFVYLTQSKFIQSKLLHRNKSKC